MRVYVLLGEPYHEASVLLGVFSALESAQAAAPNVMKATERHWQWSGWSANDEATIWSSWVAEPEPCGIEMYTIYEEDLKP